MTLRNRLRRDLSASHGVLDERVSLFSLTDRRGFTGFLRMQQAALGRLQQAEAGGLTRALIPALLARTEADLAELNAAPLSPHPAPLHPLDPLAVDYVIAGSRLGTVLLRARWAASENPDVQRAAQYFSAPDGLDIWRAVAETARAMPAETRQADRIVADAAALLTLYGDLAARAALEDASVHV
ncbi:hypothetical protein [Poseidonocella sedimentorum]|uniref:Heme oxygenase n=1 Tax=Poseidonocella sedimentorum TaxID=871652 RepID=A0A1I6DID1_9RHOB|nr:hypothetical protein [Poseidonocella sedimentorum]SFR05158.1 Heme oxygenase [Poseidonocella sedimentorum]